MILNGTEDLRVQKTMEAIHDAFSQLICKYNYEDITIKELCSLARINKKTFYHYYTCLDDLTAEMQSVMSLGYLKRIADYRIPEDLDKINREFFLYSESQGLVYEKITCSHNYGSIRNTMINDVMSSTWEKAPAIMKLDEPHRNILLHFIETASVEIYCQWVKDGKKIPLEEIIALSNELLCSGVDKFIHLSTQKERFNPKSC